MDERETCRCPDKPEDAQQRAVRAEVDAWTTVHNISDAAAAQAESTDEEGDASDGDMSSEQESDDEDEDFSTPSKLPVDVPPGLLHAHEQLTGIMSKKFAASPASAIETVVAAGETAKQRAQDSRQHRDLYGTPAALRALDLHDTSGASAALAFLTVT
eukprot:COSAG01_NODE_20850_length_932_cov_0.753902_1_plen_157_part_10